MRSESTRFLGQPRETKATVLIGLAARGIEETVYANRGGWKGVWRFEQGTISRKHFVDRHLHRFSCKLLNDLLKCNNHANPCKSDSYRSAAADGSGQKT